MFQSLLNMVLAQEKELKGSKVNWLVIEENIRLALRSVVNGTLTHEQACIIISETLGVHTGRGFEIPVDFKN